jgi:hypothetical protein
MRHLLLLALFAPLIASAQSALDGTWKARVDSATFAGKPLVQVLNKGMLECTSCVPPIKVKADGKDQKVTGHDYFDTVAVQSTDPSSVDMTYKLGGKVTATVNDNVSRDGDTLARHYSDHSGPKEVAGDIMYKRVAAGPKGSHAISGTWQRDKLNSLSMSGQIMTFKVSATGVKMSGGDGTSYEAKFDGVQVPVQGDVAKATVSLKRIGAASIEETDYNNGQLTAVFTITASADGKTLNTVYDSKREGRTVGLVFDKL